MIKGMSKVKQCYDYFVKHGIWSDDENVFRSNFRKWALKNHPDKAPGNEEIFKLISECKNSINSFDDFKRTAQFMSSAPSPPPQYARPQPQYTRPQPQYTRPQPQPQRPEGQQKSYYGDNHPKFGPRPQARNLEDLKRFAKQVFEEAEIEAKKVSSMSRDDKIQILNYFTEKLQYVLGIYNVDDDTAANKLYENTILAIYSIFEGETVYPKWRAKKRPSKKSAKKSAKRKSAKRKSAKRKSAKSKSAKRKSAKSKSAKRKSAKSKSAKRKSAKSKSAKRKSAKRKSAKRKSSKGAKSKTKRSKRKSSKRKSSKRKSSKRKSSKRKSSKRKSSKRKSSKSKSRSRR